MFTDHSPHIRAILRSGAPLEIGVGSRAGLEFVRSRRAYRVPIVLAFAAIYLIWGSTYLGIRYAVETIPPLLMMAIRHCTAGGLLYAWVRWRGNPAPTLRQWGYAAIAGALLFLGSHGSLAWAEQKVPSGLAALLSATLPLWTVLLARTGGSERKLGRRAWAGMLLGFAGVGVLIGPDVLTQNAGLNLLACAAVLGGAFSWALGTVYVKSARMPESTVLAASMQILCGGLWLLVLGMLTGEARAFHTTSVSALSVLALAYLIVFGSIIAFTAFTWLVKVGSPSRVSTYAYVNPVIAVLLGWAVAGEPLGIHTLVATAIIVAGVALVTTKNKGTAEIVAAEFEHDLQRAAAD